MIAMHPAILHRLVSARFLLDSSGPRLNKHSDSRSVAHAVLIAHDAAELALGAMIDHFQAKVSSKATFGQLADAVSEKLSANGLPGHHYLNKLNNVRVAFKHHGELPDSGSWFDVIETTTNHLNDACLAVFNLRLIEVDTSDLIEDVEAHSLIKEAKQLKKDEFFKESLEKTGLALDRINWSPSNLPYISLGKADPHLALLLSGYGIDPSSFIVLQELLPRIQLNGPKWTLHQNGHPHNWVEENASFCLDTAVQIILLLQRAPHRPRPINFYDVYRYVFIVNTEHAEVRRGRRVYLSGAEDDIFTTSVPIPGFTAGDKIYGRAVCCADPDGRFTDEDLDLSDASWLKVDHPYCEKLSCQTEEFLIVRREHVNISYEENPDSLRSKLMRSGAT